MNWRVGFLGMAGVLALGLLAAAGLVLALGSEARERETGLCARRLLASLAVALRRA